MATTSKIDADGKEFHAAFPTVLEKTDVQLRMLMGVYRGMEEVMSSSDRADYNQYPNDVVQKASGTAIMALHQIDNILDDPRRWSVDESDLEKNYTACLKSAAAITDAQVIRAKLDSMPHVRHGARLARVGLNDWVAVLGTGDGQQVLGRGPSPQAALDAFDRVFLQGIDPKVVAEMTTPAKKVRQKTNKTKKSGP
jgi:hypothetical protein